MQDSFSISIPLDQDGFVELECDYCKTRFMLGREVYEDEKYIDFFCPICGLANSINTFFVPEVLEEAQQIATNIALDELNRALNNSCKQINKNGLIKMSVKTPKKEHVRELYHPINDYEVCSKKCCNLFIKLKAIDKATLSYCPVCGVMNDE